MQREVLTLATLATLDQSSPDRPGKIAAAFNLAIQQAMADIHNRPREAKQRVITLKTLLTPVGGDEDGVDAVDVQFICEAKMPAKHTRAYSMDVEYVGRESAPMPAFATNHPANTKQGTFEDLAEEPERTE